jgi:YVTN family beta-propeller protein
MENKSQRRKYPVLLYYSILMLSLSLIIINIISLSSLISLAAVAETLNQPNRSLDKTAAADDTNDTLSYRPYNNPINGLSLRYPVGWEENTDGSYVEFSPLLKGDTTDLYTKISIDNDTMHGLTLQELVSKKGFTLINIKQTNLSGIIGYELLYRFKGVNYSDYYREVEYNEMQIISSLNNKVYYSFIYSAEQSRYTKYLPVIEGILDNLAISFQKNDRRINIEGIKIANIPAGMNFNPNNDELYVANFGSDTLSIINVNSKTVKNITVGNRPEDVTSIPIDNVIFVANLGSNSVSIIDGTTYIKTKDIEVSSAPYNVAADPDQNDRFVFVTNRDSDSVSVISGSELETIMEIPVGNNPLGIDVNPLMNRIYIANYLSGTLSIIDYFQNSNGTLGYNYDEIPIITNTTDYQLDVGYPSDVAVDLLTNTIFVTSDDGLSIINGSSYETIKTLDLENPDQVAINPNDHTIFLTSPIIEGIYVIDSEKEEIEPINLGYIPASISANTKTNHIYVSAGRVNSIDVINATSKKIMVGVTFNIDNNMGEIICNNKKILNKFIMYDINTILECEAKANSGFAFSSWSGDVSQASHDNSNTPSTLSDYLFGSWFNDETNTKSTFKVSKYGTLNINFISPIPVSIPPEFWTPFYGLIPGFFVPSIISWLNGRRQRGRLEKYMKKIDNNHDKLSLEKIKPEIAYAYSKGKINESHLGLLKDKISEYEKNMS